MLLKIVIAVVFVIWCILGAVAIINEIRADPADPPFTIMEKRENIDAEARKRIEQMIEDMKKD